MGKVKDFINMRWLMFKAKTKKAYESTSVQWLLSTDITFIFLFLGLKLFNYRWTWFNLIASIGAWIVTKELFKQVRILLIAKEISK